MWRPSVEELFANPRHPYTKALLSAILLPKVGGNPEFIPIRGEVTSLSASTLGRGFLSVYARAYIISARHGIERSAVAGRDCNVISARGEIVVR
ncbi:MAG: hypothetical protein GX847_07510 [Clostridiales bacterium]|nr:hypothetical protein [Clostridiales bacterium]